jgi:hypothetical protein
MKFRFTVLDKTRLFMALIALLFALQACVVSKPVPSGNDVIKQMYDKWNVGWCKNMAFEQQVWFYKNDSVVKEEVWQELIKPPGRLHIRYNGFESGNGAIFTNDTVNYFKNGELSRKEARVHHLLLLAFDVYFFPPEESRKKLEAIGFDLGRAYTQKVNGRKTYVVGAANASDSSSSQFWIDSENLYLVRVILNKNNNLSDVILLRYQTVDGYPVATDILFKSNGKKVMLEKYFNIQFPETVHDSLFNSTGFKSILW